MGSCCAKVCGCLFGSKNTSNTNRVLLESLINSKSSTNSTNPDNNLWTSSVNFGDFEILMLLGKGTFGRVVLARMKKNKKLYALKILIKAKIQKTRQIEHTKTERLMLEKNNHPFIVKLKYAFQSHEELCFVTDYMQGGELFYHLRKNKFFTEENALFYISETVLAIEYLHKNNCIYRDLKPENILLDKNGHIRLADFGLSKILNTTDCEFEDENIAYTMCGSPGYLAPEILIGRGYTKDVDWWSLGCILFVMLNGYPPFRPKKDSKKLNIQLYEQPIVLKEDISKDAKSLILGLLSIDPYKRLGAGKNDADSIKSHVFFKGINWNDVYDMKLSPPIVPRIASDEDPSNFDKLFTDQNPNKSSREKYSSEEFQDFQGFTYNKSTSY